MSLGTLPEYLLLSFVLMWRATIIWCWECKPPVPLTEMKTIRGCICFRVETWRLFLKVSKKCFCSEVVKYLLRKKALIPSQRCLWKLIFSIVMQLTERNESELFYITAAFTWLSRSFCFPSSKTSRPELKDTKALHRDAAGRLLTPTPWRFTEPRPPGCHPAAFNGFPLPYSWRSLHLPALYCTCLGPVLTAFYLYCFTTLLSFNVHAHYQPRV